MRNRRDQVSLRIDPSIIAVISRSKDALVAPGVLATVAEHDGCVEINLVIAVVEGSGDVGRWLDTLPRDRPVRVVNVVSERLAGMLRRRGFVDDGDDLTRG